MSVDPDFVYTPATTDVSIRWRQLYGWVPPSEQPAYQKKWADFRMQAARGVESIKPEEDPIYTAPPGFSATILKWKRHEYH
jgi:hypothetical protein